jgi:hypothetical protein
LREIAEMLAEEGAVAYDSASATVTIRRANL